MGENQQRGGHRGFACGTILRVLLGLDVEQLVPEAEVDAQVGKHAPGKQCRRREDRLVVGGKHGG